MWLLWTCICHYVWQHVIYCKYFLLMCAYVYIFVLCVYVCTCRGGWRVEIDVGCPPQRLSILFFGMRSLTESAAC